METFDVLILGAGIVGTACARECAAAGMRVGVVEPAVLGGGATAAGMGHVVLMDDSPAQLALSRFSRDLWRDLRAQLPQGVEYEECGTLWLAVDAEEMAEVFAKRETYAHLGVDSEVLDEKALREVEPNLRQGMTGALLVPHDGVIYPPAAAAFFLEAAIAHGARHLRGKRAIRAAAGEVVLDDGTRLNAAHIVIATGTDISLCPWLAVQPRKGHLVITDRYPGFVRHQLVELGYLKSAHAITADSVAFNAQPRKTGQILLGSSRQFGDVEPTARPKMVRRMLDRAIEYLPGLGSLSAIRVWTGFRAATPDKLPYIGPTPDPTVLVAMGFEGLGITNAPGTARLVLHHLTGAQVVLDPAPYLPSRAAVTEALYA
ncbi:MAG TPA: FAD-dependent oxidoreductase [Terriglobales bacterium]|nr:FAD-dependent oxidoreductase [Terriglobales bacterium]